MVNMTLNIEERERERERERQEVKNDVSCLFLCKHVITGDIPLSVNYKSKDKCLCVFCVYKTKFIAPRSLLDSNNLDIVSTPGQASNS
jgi:hypothetical protein